MTAPDLEARSATIHRSAFVVGTIWLVGCSALTTVDLLPVQGTSGGASSARRTSAAQGGAATVSGTSGGVANEGERFELAGAAGIAGLTSGLKLVNRYDFSGTGTTIVDLVGNKDGTAMGGAVLDGSGQLTLAGGQQQYVALPSWLISSMSSVTIVAFITWHGGSAWQSVFNFGATDTGAPSEDVRAQFFFTPLTSVGNGPSLHVEMQYGHGPLDFVDGTDRFPADVPSVVASVFDGDRGELSLYINGTIVLQPDPTSQRLAELKDANCWLGQSQWAHDVTGGGNFRGSYDEFRIYSGALSAEQIGSLSLTDPDAL